MPPGSPLFGRLAAIEDAGTPSFHSSSAAGATPALNAQPNKAIGHRLSMCPIPARRPYRFPVTPTLSFDISRPYVVANDLQVTLRGLRPDVTGGAHADAGNRVSVATLGRIPKIEHEPDRSEEATSR